MHSNLKIEFYRVTMSFAIQTEYNKKMPILGITNELNKFTTNNFCKSSSSSACTRFDSVLPSFHKINLAKVQFRFKPLKEIFQRNSYYTQNVTDSASKSILLKVQCSDVDILQVCFLCLWKIMLSHLMSIWEFIHKISQFILKISHTNKKKQF